MFERYLRTQPGDSQKTETTAADETNQPKQVMDEEKVEPSPAPQEEPIDPVKEPEQEPAVEEEQEPAAEEEKQAPVVPELPDEEEDPINALPVPEEKDTTLPPPPPSFFNEPTSKQEDDVEASDESVEEKTQSEPEIVEKKAIDPSAITGIDDSKIVRGESLHTVDFADIWFTPEDIAYVRDTSTRFALTPIETDDLEEFHRALEQGFTGSSSYAIKFAGDSYRVERVNTADGLQYNCRKMPTTTPEIETLGFDPAVVKHLTSLGKSSGLLLFAGPTGQGKTTTVSALMKRFLDTDGGFLYTIEDPPEMPLSGVYHSKNGGLGLCKQVPVENDQWGAGLRSALRSRPRYILVGEIRTPETASQCLVAATSGHLVLSTIHANGVEDALNSMIKYAASTGLDSDLAADLLARGILGVVYQRLEGTSKLKLIYQSAFANPNAQAADQMRMAIRDTNINLATFMEQQRTRMDRGLPMFRD